MKLIKTSKSKKSEVIEERPWKLLIVDDEPDIHNLTKLSLGQFRFDNRGLAFISAMSAKEAMEILAKEDDIALALVDIVMETEDAGLKLVEYIRKDLKNHTIRLIVRTGQPGVAPEKFVIDNFDIDDYKDKTELTASKLYAAVRSTLKAYRDISVIANTRIGLEHILNVTPELYFHTSESLTQFFEGLLTQITSLCHLNRGSMFTAISGAVMTLNGSLKVYARSGDLASDSGSSKMNHVTDLCQQFLQSPENPPEIPDDALLLPLGSINEQRGCVYLEGAKNLHADDLHLIKLMTHQYTSALSNRRLHMDLMRANEEALRMLAMASEFKDEDTGAHIYRMRDNTRLICQEFGLEEEICHAYAEASILHDVGKLGIPDEILAYPGPLSDASRAVIQTHTTIGEQILGGDSYFELARQVAIGHHERWDGNGYPHGIAGENIPLIARISAIVDVFDALIHKRPYKEAWSIADAIEEIRRARGTQFDPQVVDAFLNLHQNGRLHLN